MSQGPTEVRHCALTGIFGITIDPLGPCSGRVTAIATDPTDSSGNTLYVGGAQGGVWKSTDGGTTWTSLLDNPVQPNGVPLTNYTIAVGSITVDASGVVYVATGEPNAAADAHYGAGILKSADGGATWSQLGLSRFFRTMMFDVVVNPANTSQLLAAVNTGLFRSADGGATWQKPNFSMNNSGASFTSIVQDPTSTSTVYAAGGGEIFKSTDFGATWSPSTTSSSPGCFATAGTCVRISLAIAASSPSTVVAAGDDGNLYQTTNSGSTWSMLSGPSGGLPFPMTNYCTAPLGSQCTYDMFVAVDPTDPSIIFLGGQDLWVTFDGGMSWGDFGGYNGTLLPGGNIHVDQHALAFSPADHQKIFVGNDGGIWTARWHPRQIGGPIFPWVDLNIGLSITQFYAVAANPRQLGSFFGGTQDLGVLDHDDYSSLDHVLGSTQWDDTDAGDGGWAAYDPSDPRTQYAGFVGWSGGGCAGALASGSCLLRRDSTSHCCNGLNGWFGVFQTTGTASPFPTIGAVDPTMPTTLYFPSPTTHTLFKTTDRGATWTPTGLSLTAGCGGFSCVRTALSSIAVAPSNGSVVYVGSDSGKFLASTDGGATFSQRDSGVLPPFMLEDIAVDPSDPNTVFAVFNSFSGGVGRHVFVSHNAGNFSVPATWTDISTGLPNFPVHSVLTDPTGSGAIYIGTDTGVYISTDTGATWQVLGTGLPRVQVVDLAFSAGNVALVAATHGRGVWTISHLPQHPLTYVVTQTFGAGPNAQTFETDCYPGDIATGGGFEIPSGVVREAVFSEPNVMSGQPTGWQARFGVGTAGAVTVYADCMVGTPVGGVTPSSYVVETDRTIACFRIGVCVSSPAGGVTANCNGSDPATGGGFETGGSKVVRDSKPNVTTGTPTGWDSFFGISGDPSDIVVKSFVVCLPVAGFSTSAASTAAPFGTSAGGVSVMCPSGTAAVGGGFSFVRGTHVPLISRPDVPSGVAAGWFTFFGAGIGTGGGAPTGTAFVVCLSGGTSATVACTPSSVLVGVATSCAATIANLDPSTSVAPTGSVAFTSDKPGSFSPASQSCNLSASGATAACAVQFTPAAGSVGAVSITATYGGDSTHGGSTGSASINVFDFTVTVSPQNSTVLRGGSTIYSVTTSLVAGSLGAPSSLGWSVSGLPSDAASTHSALPLPGTGALTVYTGSTSLGDFVLTISGTVQGGSRSATANLHLYDFTVAATPASLQILTTGSNAYTISVQLVAGSSTVGLPPINLAVAGLPAGASGAFSGGSGTPNFSSTLTITTVGVAAGTYTLTVTGTDGRSPQGGSRVTHPSLAVLTVAQALQNVIDQINNLHNQGVLNNGQANSLIVKLTHASDELTNRPDKQTGCNQLNAFVNEVHAYTHAGILTQAQADALLNPPLGVLAIMASIPC